MFFPHAVLDDTDDVIDEPKNNPAARRVWELVSVFQQAEDAWHGLIYGIAEGYSSAWYRQQKVLDGVEAEIEADMNERIFLLSIFCAGISGGLLGGVIGGAFSNTSEIPREIFAAVGDDGVARHFVKAAGEIGVTRDVMSRVSDDAASQFGGTMWDSFQRSTKGSVFEPPGAEPSTYEPGMHRRVSVLFVGLRETIGQVILDIQSGFRPASDGEKCFQHFRNQPYINKLPTAKKIGRDFTKEASLCLWIAWGAQRDFGYWTTAWNQALRGMLIGPVPDEYDYSKKFGRYISTAANYTDIVRWDPIIDEIKNISPQLVIFVLQFAPGYNVAQAGRRPEIMYAGMHIDVRNLKDLGLFSDIESARAMSQYFKVHGMLMNPDTAKTALVETFGRGNKLVRHKG